MILAPKDIEREQRLDFHLLNWRDWQRREYRQRYAKMRFAWNPDVDQMTDAADVRCAQTVNALIEDLSPAEASAIYHRYLHAVFRFPRGNYSQLLLDAREKIGEGLKRRGVW